MNTAVPYFSVIIPTHRRIRLLTLAIQSVLKQTNQSFDVHVVNDEPEDHLLLCKILARFNDKRIALHTHDSGLGVSYSRNLGILRSQGAVLAFLDDDDEWVPEKLEVHARLHEKVVEAGLVYSGTIKRWEPLLFPDHIRLAKEIPGNLFELPCSEGLGQIHTVSAVTVRREVFDQCGLFHPHLKTHEDWDFYLRASRVTQFQDFPLPLAVYRQHAGDRLTEKAKLNVNLVRFLERYEGKIDQESVRLEGTRVSSERAILTAAIGKRPLVFLKNCFVHLFVLEGEATFASPLKWCLILLFGERFGFALIRLAWYLRGVNRTPSPAA